MFELVTAFWQNCPVRQDSRHSSDPALRCLRATPSQAHLTASWDIPILDKPSANLLFRPDMIYTQQRHRIALTARGLALLSATTFALMLPNAHAALGGNAASVNTDRAALAPTGTASAASSTLATKSALASTTSTASTSNTSSTGAYTMQSIVDVGGTTIHEYLDSSGAVFAIAWNGPFVPNLSQLLGTYFADYTSAVAANQGSQTVRSPAAVETGELVVKSGGHMQAYRGMAYLKNRLPGGFTVDQIR